MLQLVVEITTHPHQNGCFLLVGSDRSLGRALENHIDWVKKMEKKESKQQEEP